MTRIVNQSHDKLTVAYAFSRMFERSAYYGVRTLIVLYMIGESLNFSKEEAFFLIGWMGTAMMISKILGALLGDLLIGNKRAIILGALLQVIGIFLLIISSIYSLYIGIILFVIGSGLYSPNLYSKFGKLYLSKTDLLDSAFTLLYLASNFGAFFGVLAIGIVGEYYGYHFGFILAGVLMLIAGIIPALMKDRDESVLNSTNQTVGIKHIGTISTIFAVVGLFWFFYTAIAMSTFDVQFGLSDDSEIPFATWSTISAVSVLVISVIFAVRWSFHYSNQLVKLTIGCIFMVLSIAVLFLIPDFPTANYLWLYMVSLLLLGISEIHIAPIIHSMLTKYTSTKYLAITMSLVLLPIAAIGYVVSFFTDGLYLSNFKGLVLAFAGMLLISIALIIYHFVNKKRPKAS